MKAFIVMGRTLRAAYDELFLCVFLSIVWWIGTILVLTAAPATMGLNHVTNRVANYKRVDNSFFWEGARTNIAKGWILYLIVVLAPVAIAINIRFYLASPATWMRIIAIAWVWILVLVLMMMQYIFPLMWQQDEPSLKMALRNAFLLALRFPLYTFLMFIFQILLLALSVAITIPVFLLTPALLGLASNHTLVGALQEMDLAPQPPVIPKR